MNIIPSNQFGFRAAHSTTHAAVALKTDIAQKLNQKIPTLACLLDVEKAFDTTWTEGVIFKLIKLKFNSHLIKTLYSFLSNRRFQVRVDDTLSRTFNVCAGVPQGSLLGPILYNIYLYDIPSPIPLPIPIKTLQYADDLVIYTSRRNIRKAAEVLNNHLNELYHYFTKWKIKVNVAKCEAIVFKGSKILSKHQRADCKNVQLKINGTSIKNSRYVNYLGIIMSEDLRTHQHVKHMTQKAFIAYNCLRMLLHYKSPLQKQIKLICYKQLIRPIIAYGFRAWSDLTSSQMEGLRRFERKILRNCVGIYRKPDSVNFVNNKSLYSASNVTRIDNFLVNNYVKFFEKASNSNNPIIKDSVEETSTPHDKYRIPCAIIHLKQSNQLYNEENQLILYHRPYRQTSQHLVYNLYQ